MLERLFTFEDWVLGAEKAALVVCVLGMLGLAGYTVFYRNVLIPWQTRLATSGPPLAGSDAAPTTESTRRATGAQPGEDHGQDADFGGGFGGGFGEDEKPAEDGQPQDTAGGFGGGFGGGDSTSADGADSGDNADQSGGFGGGFGAENPPSAKPSNADQTGAAVAEPSPTAAEPALGGPPPDGSISAGIIETIDVLKLSWIDVLLRQLVIVCGFLGAMLATRRRSHITVDAVGTLLEGRTEHVVGVVTNTAAAAMCVVLAVSGWDLVAIGLKYPRDLVPWASEWTFQLAFPIGWGLLGFHFLMRVIESAGLAADDDPKADQTPGADHAGRGRGVSS